MSNVKIQCPSIAILLTGLLCILKITGVLSISWWWCFCLIWLPFAILFALIGLVSIITVILIICALIIELIKILRE